VEASEYLSNVLLTKLKAEIECFVDKSFAMSIRLVVINNILVERIWILVVTVAV